jgi:hypothetical protein
MRKPARDVIRLKSKNEDKRAEQCRDCNRCEFRQQDDLKPCLSVAAQEQYS